MLPVAKITILGSYNSAKSLQNNKYMNSYKYTNLNRDNHFTHSSRHICCLLLSIIPSLFLLFWFTCSFHSMSDHHLAKELSLSSVHVHSLPRYPKLVFSSNIPFQAQNTPFQNCIPSLWLLYPSPLAVYPRLTRRPGFPGTLPVFDPLSRFSGRGRQNIKMSRFSIAVPVLSRFFQWKQ